MTRPYKRHLVRGKPIRYWAEQLGVCLKTAYIWNYRGVLENRIDGGGQVYPATVGGLTYRQVAERLVASYSAVRRWAKDGTIERRMNRETIPRKTPPTPPPKPIYNGMGWRELAERLGNGKPLSRQRVHQLIESGHIQDRLDGLDVARNAMDKRRAKTKAKYNAILSKRQPGESLSQFAKRLGIPYMTLYTHCPVRPDFAAERKAMREVAT